MPAQKPGKSRQDYGTPPDFLHAVRHRLGIDRFSIDLAATKANAVCPIYYSLEEGNDSLSPQCPWTGNGWAWLNPPFAKIGPWVEKATMEARLGAHVAVLVPASFAGWWFKWVEPYAYVNFLGNRITFVGETTAYPKDCALLLYTPWAMTGNEVWRWKP